MVVLVSGFAIGMNARMSMWHGRRPFWFGIADWGFLGCFAAFAVYGFANVESSAQMIAYVFVGVLFIAACRFAFMEFEAWWLGLAFAAIMLLITGQYLLFTLPHPEWFFDFLPSLLILTSLALIVTGSVVSHIHTGQVDATDEGPSLGIPAMRGVAGVVIALAGRRV
jgi:membrane protein YdbS with pleckstrin-like domain